MREEYSNWFETVRLACKTSAIKRFYGTRSILSQLLLLIALTVSGPVMAQTAITGTVTDEETGDALPGVTIQIKNSAIGVITDLDGKYRINANTGDVLVYSFVGFVNQEVTVASQSQIDVTLSLDIQELGEVVVTAFGIKREKKAVTYAVQNVSTEEFSEAKSLNVSNSLSGKVAGLAFSTTGSGVGSSSRVTLRGNRSLNGNNQPLYVIDGMPIDNSRTEDTNSDEGGRTSFDGISNISPDDIESISVLKGPSAAALYGTRASNGVIIINTKTGKKGVNFSLSSNLMFSKAYDLLNLQNEYGQGTAGVYDPTSRTSWGPRMQGQTVGAWQLSFNPNYEGPATYEMTPQPDNVNDFFELGYNWSKTFSANAGNDQFQSYLSYTNTEAEGIVGGNKLTRHNFNLRLTGNLLDNLKLDAKANYINQEVDNAIGAGTSSVAYALYATPRSMHHSQYKDAFYRDEYGQIQYNYPDPNTLATGGDNPYWYSTMQNRVDQRNRFIGFASLLYNFTDELSLKVASGLDYSADKWAHEKHANISVNNNDDGSYSEGYGFKTELNSSFLLAYDKQISDFSVNVSFGGNALYQDREGITTGGQLSNRNFFSLQNIENMAVTNTPYEREVNSLYGFTRIGFRDYLYLDVTGRNDWSSTLPANNRSFFYPSIGLTGVISDIFDIQSDFLTFLKFRASWAQVGNDTDPYQTYTAFNYESDNGGVAYSATTLGNENLKPEISSSTELGIDARFLKNRIGLDVTVYETTTENQIFRVNTPSVSGYTEAVVNGGDIQNRGLELVLNGTIVETKNLTWDATLNYSAYETKILKIGQGQDTLSLGSGRLVKTQVVDGGQFGDLYVKGYQRTDDGEIIVDETTGLPLITPGFDVYAGNYRPKFIGGLQNKLNYKNVSLSFLVGFRVGGKVVSFTQARLAGLGVTDVTLEGREEGIIVDGVNVTRNEDGSIAASSPNGTVVTAQEYWTTVGAQDPIAEDFIFDATNVRLRELVLGYSLPSKMLKNTPFTGVNFSLVGRNLFFFYNKAKYFDPEQGASLLSSLQGVESFNLPATRNFGFNVKLNF